MSYGTELYQKTLKKYMDNGWKQRTAFDAFVLSSGEYYKTKEILDAAFERWNKANNGEILTEAEFNLEVSVRGYCSSNIKADLVYEVLASLIDKGIANSWDVYNYAVYGWCLQNPEAITYYNVSSPDRNWAINRCDTSISEIEAKIHINSNFGFEVGRLEIIDKPYCSATDYNFIRFNCNGWNWLMQDGDLYLVLI